MLHIMTRVWIKIHFAVLPSPWIMDQTEKSRYAKNWCFTLNNYTPDDERKFQELDCQFLIYGREVGEQGTPHLQGYVQLHDKKRLTWLKKNISYEAHWEAAKGTMQDSIVYCSKQDPNPFKKGVERHCGRNDLNAFKDAVKEGGYTAKRAREEFSEISMKYPRFVDAYIADQYDAAADVAEYPLNDWQQELWLKLQREPDDRKIIFVVDIKGGSGKTWFAKWYEKHHRAQLLTSGKFADMAYALNMDNRVLFINCTRQQQEFLSYSFLEAVKDQRVFSTKYESRVKHIPKCHVVVMMNQEPDPNMLSEDRYDRILASWSK